MQSNTFSGLFVGQKIITLQRVDSTNRFLREKLSNFEPVAEGTVIMAVDQYAGRGQQGNAWWSEPGKNLTLSMLLKPGFLHPEAQFDLNRTISVAVCDTLTPLIGDQLSIKWPNDIYAGNLKMGGILIENIVQGNFWKYAVIGIGINVNQTDFKNLSGKSCSIKQLLHADYDLNILLSDLCKAIAERYFLLKEGGISKLREAYLQNLFGLNEYRQFLVDGIMVSGSIRDVNAKGRLIIDFDGHMADFGAKEIGFVID
ncbi:BirA family transcriptional regulator, biotin operon repressor / biotin-[acetyl-CoA-carboxylase] ligase [bacterium A37T11]|nr:BirA family transcriptional regulator, biotin operon repressor / biotin-[acetyl-CoA-carboxylase] ligase [bacterium A37T11]